ncbi:hypothetical protein QFW77_02685 [Luteimonas sp. RD2P54]|uniref:Cell envelope integrity protein TolA n=1 Tax=Luteimonas endophytica TaxID=3042023 RepID=A0ABT6J525_9GAMM|nr:hypothetical protein [Luteimonas endophytica]MDH5821901.1 hypothetical protein [Luteimonas endophytica]
MKIGIPGPAFTRPPAPTALLLFQQRQQDPRQAGDRRRQTLGRHRKAFSRRQGRRLLTPLYFPFGLRKSHALKLKTMDESWRLEAASALTSILAHALLIGAMLYQAKRGPADGELQGLGEPLVVQYITTITRPSAISDVDVEPQEHEDADENPSNEFVPPIDEPPPADLGEGSDLIAADSTGVSVHDEGAAATPNSGSIGSDQDLAARYRSAVRSRIGAVWEDLSGTSLPSNCVLSLRLEPGGAVLEAQASGCELDSAQKNQLEAAALMAQPLPYSGFESVFSSDLDLDLK